MNGMTNMTSISSTVAFVIGVKIIFVTWNDNILILMLTTASLQSPPIFFVNMFTWEPSEPPSVVSVNGNGNVR